MSEASALPTRCAVLVGGYTSGKTTLLEALLHTAGATARQGRVTQGNTVGDSSRQARDRQMTVEPNVAHATYLDDPWTLLDCPGSVELAYDTRTALMAADMAVVVAEPDPDKAPALAPLFRFLDAQAIPHILFVNKMDRASASAREMLAALQAVSNRPLLLRQVPIRAGEAITGYVDLVSERAYRYRDGQPSELVQMPAEVQDREDSARRELLEALADFDDTLLEKLLEDVIPAPEEIYAQLARDVRQDLVVPVLLGAAERDHGITRLWKALRHETPQPTETAQRLGVLDAVEGAGADLTASVVKTFHQAHTGKLSLARIWQGGLRDGVHICGHRVSGIYRLRGSDLDKTAQAGPGDVVALARVDALQTGDVVAGKEKLNGVSLPWPAPPEPVYDLAVEPEKRADEVKLTSGLHRLTEEDPSLAMAHDETTGQILLRGQGEMHLGLALERLRQRFNVGVTAHPAPVAYKETIRKSLDHHTRFKRQTGGHGQFADIQVTIRPQPRGSGFAFSSSVVGGAVPKTFIPAVEHGLREGLQSGPLGFPVVDLAVELRDGQYHSVDSSEQAFKTAGRMALAEGLPKCEPILLEPVTEVVISVPQSDTSKVHGLVSGRRGQILGFETKADWPDWDELRAYMPESETTDLILELRSLTQGLGFFTRRFSHMQELTGKLADKVLARQGESAP